MSYPYFTLGLPGALASRPAVEIPTLDRDRTDDPARYLPDQELTHAVNVALVLGMPLLVTGEPGTGKTQLASAVAYALQAPLHRFETKSTSLARDLLYTFDAVSSFKQREQTDARVFIRYQALGLAILEAFAADHPRLEALLPPAGAVGAQGAYRHPGQRRAVVLIDEIDKAPRDFPNDLLTEIDRLWFRVPELQYVGSPGAAGPEEPGVEARYRPIVIITSNSEKGLPDAFLRRCVYFDIPFPGKEAMAAIVAGRISGIDTNTPLLADALALFYRLRPSPRGPRVRTGAGGAIQGPHANLRKPPSTAELINWLQILVHRGVGPNARLKDYRALVKETLAALVKTPEDRIEAERLLEGTWT